MVTTTSVIYFYIKLLIVEVWKLKEIKISCLIHTKLLSYKIPLLGIRMPSLPYKANLNVLNVIISATRPASVESGLNTCLNLKLTYILTYKWIKEAGNKIKNRTCHVGSSYKCMIKKKMVCRQWLFQTHDWRQEQVFVTKKKTQRRQFQLWKQCSSKNQRKMSGQSWSEDKSTECAVCGRPQKQSYRC